MRVNFTKTLSALVLFALLNFNATAQYFTEDFENGFPADWTQITTNTTETFQIVNTGYLSANSISCNYDANVMPQDEWVITPSIDLSAATNPTLFFAFLASNYWAVTPNNNYDIIISARTNGGAWTVVWNEDIYLATGATFETFVYTPTSVDLTAYAGESDVQLGFQYLGTDGATGGFDQISISEPIQNDMVLEDYARAPAFSTPVGLASEFEFGVNIRNSGAAEQTGVMADLDITSPSAVMTNLNVDYGNMPADSARLEAFDLFNADEVGEYTFNYTISQDQTDEFPLNNTGSGSFLVTNSLFALDNGDIVSTNSALPAGIGDGETWRAGNWFSIPDYDMNKEFYVTSASMILAKNNVTGAPVVEMNGKDYVVNLYKINSGVLSNDSLIDVAFGIQTYPATGDFDYMEVFPELEALEGDTIWLERNTEYALVATLDNSTGFGYSTNDYPLNLATIVESGGTWFGGGFGANLTGAFRLNVASKSLVINNKNLLSDVNNLEVYPNPASGDEINVVIDLKNASKSVTLDVVDVNGKFISSKTLNNVKAEFTTINVSNLSSGTYILHMTTEDGVKSQRFNVIK